jgi:hypothetical protein
MTDAIPSEYRGWWRIVETSQWDDADIDILGPAVLSLTGHADRLRTARATSLTRSRPK